MTMDTENANANEESRNGRHILYVFHMPDFTNKTHAQEQSS